MPRQKTYHIGHPSKFIQSELFVRKCAHCGMTGRIDEMIECADCGEIVCIGCSINQERIDHVSIHTQIQEM